MKFRNYRKDLREKSVETRGFTEIANNYLPW